MSQPDFAQVQDMYLRWSRDKHLSLSWQERKMAFLAFEAGCKAGAAFATGYCEAKQHESEVKRGR